MSHGNAVLMRGTTMPALVRDAFEWLNGQQPGAGVTITNYGSTWNGTAWYHGRNETRQIWIHTAKQAGSVVVRHNIDDITPEELICLLSGADA